MTALSQNCSSETKKLYTQRPKINLKKKYFSNNFFLSCQTECNLEHIVRKYHQKFLFRSLKAWNYFKKRFFAFNQKSATTGAWSRRMPIWQPCQGLSIGGRKYLFQLLKLYMRLITYSKTSSKCSSGYVGGIF